MSDNSHSPIAHYMGLIEDYDAHIERAEAALQQSSDAVEELSNKNPNEDSKFVLRSAEWFNYNRDRVWLDTLRCWRVEVVRTVDKFKARHTNS